MNILSGLGLSFNSSSLAEQPSIVLKSQCWSKRNHEINERLRGKRKNVARTIRQFIFYNTAPELPIFIKFSANLSVQITACISYCSCSHCLRQLVKPLNKVRHDSGRGQVQYVIDVFDGIPIGQLKLESLLDLIQRAGFLHWRNGRWEDNVKKGCKKNKAIYFL